MDNLRVGLVLSKEIYHYSKIKVSSLRKPLHTSVHLLHAFDMYGVWCGGLGIGVYSTSRERCRLKCWWGADEGVVCEDGWACEAKLLNNAFHVSLLGKVSRHYSRSYCLFEMNPKEPRDLGHKINFAGIHQFALEQ